MPLTMPGTIFLLWLQHVQQWTWCQHAFKLFPLFIGFFILLSLGIGEKKDDDYEKAQMKSVHYLLEEPKENKTYL